jgi:hypothetical protein
VGAEIRRHQLERNSGTKKTKYLMSGERGPLYTEKQKKKNAFQGRLQLVIGRNKHA